LIAEDRLIGGQLVLLRALVSAYVLRELLEKQAPSSLQLCEAMAQLLLQCGELIDDRDCRVPLALIRERIGAYLEQGSVAGSSLGRSGDDALLRFARHSLLRLIARLWALQDAERNARPCTIP
jgi:hypothetical protein